MKILKLEFESINNLRGSHCIDFTTKPLLEADIYAIIGPTGSGKSTILDVITLALFNRTPRFKKVSKNALLAEGSIITRNEKKAVAKITYLVGDVKYVSVWNIKYNSRNNLGDYHMEIWKNDVLLDLHRKDVPKENEKIIGLDYEQFTKSIILSQGEFSKFLKADHNERSILLEKITGTSIYRELGIKAFEIHRDKKKCLEQKEAVLNTVKLLQEDEVEDLKVKQIQLKKNLGEHKETIEKALVVIKQKEDFNKTETQLKFLEIQQKENLEQFKIFKKEELRLELHKKVAPFRKELSDFSKKAEVIVKNENRLKGYKEKLSVEIKRNKEVISKQKSIINEDITEENFLFKNNEFEKKVNQLISRIENISEKGKEQAKEIEQILALKDLLEFNFKANTKPSVVTSEISKIEQLLRQRNFELTSDVYVIEKDKISIEKDIQDYKELKKYKQESKEIEKNITEVLKQITDSEKLLENLPKKLLPIKREEELLGLKIQQVEIEQKIASFEEHRKELEDGKECPLCGSVDHPFENLKNEDDQKISEKLRFLKISVEENRKQFSEITTQEKVLKSKIEAYKSNILKYKENLDVLQNRTKNDLNNPVFFENKNNLNIQELLVISEKQKTDLETILRAFQKVEPLKRLQIKLQKRLELLDDYKKVSFEKNNLFKEDNISQVMNDLQNIFNESNSNIVLHQNNIKHEGESLKENQKEFEDLQKSIDLVKEKTEIQSVENLEKAILSDTTVTEIERKKEQLTEQKTKTEVLLVQVKDLFEKLNTHEIKRLNLEELIKEKTNLESENEKIIGQISAIDQQLKSDKEASKQKEVFQKDFDKAQKEFLRWEKLKVLIGDSSGKNFSSFAQGLTLKQLIAFTNKRLKSFSGRYLLYSEPSKQELMIIDTLQGNTERSVKTLSGGETFLVSLSLALSLSDMTSKNVELGSLFIDEGFGTLDENSLQNALDLLEKLQVESNKMVGVISHVKELKERISVQIQLQKDSLGHSTINIVG